MYRIQYSQSIGAVIYNAEPPTCIPNGRDNRESLVIGNEHLATFYLDTVYIICNNILPLKLVAVKYKARTSVI